MNRSPVAEPEFVRLRRLSKSFGEIAVLNDLSLAIAEGEILALLGPSGSGKTTVLRLLAGLETPDRGTIEVAGEEVTTQPPTRRRFGMVFQHYALFPHLTVGENVAFGLRSQGWPGTKMGPRVAAMLELVDLAGFDGRRVTEISGGQQQRVALARALAPEPRLLLLDEPLSNLDPSLRERTRRELRAAVQRVGITSVLVTHEQAEAFHVGDRVAVLHRGRLEQVGRPEELYATPATRFVATFVGRGSTLPGTVEEAAGDRVRIRLDQGPEGAVCWPAVGRNELAAGQAAELVARPEGLELVGAETPDAVTGRVVERRFTGPLTYATVLLPGGVELEVLVDPAGRPLEERVFVAPRPGGPAPFAFVPDPA